MEINKVNVKIYGQGYTIAGEKDRDEIQKVAGYVDGKMRDISQKSNLGSHTALAVLTAVNITDELFELRSKYKELQAVNEQLEKDTKHYIGLWDEAKEKNRAREVGSGGVKELREKYKELESNYFELQMENVQLKNQLDRVKQD